MATSTCTLNGIKYNNAAGKYGNWANYSYKTSGAMYAGWAGAEGLDCAMVFKITVPAFTGISSSFSITMGLQNQVDNGGPTTLNWSLATSDSYVTGNKYADGVNYPLTNNGEFDRGTVSLNFRYASYTPYTLTFNTSQITSGGTYYLILYRYDKTGISTQYPTSVTFNYKNTYTVSYNANGGSGAPAAQTKVEGTNLTLSSTKPTKASSVTYPTGTITISYAANGGSSTPSAGTGTYTNQRTVPYSFSHWNTASNNTGTTYYAGGTYTSNAGATLYAQYSAGSATETRYSNPSIKTAAAISRANGSVTGYKVSFNANGGSSTPTAITSTKTRKYTFAHWKNTSSGSTFSASTNYTFSVNATLTAQWNSSDTNNAITLPAAISRANASAGSYTVTFNANGGSCSTSSLSAARTTKYTFGGWNTNSSGTGTNYSASSSYTPSAATTLYAKWSSSTSTAAITLPTPTRDGYTFKGWSTSSTATSGSTGSYTPTSNITLYATWSQNQITGTVKIWNGSTWVNGTPYIYNGSSWVKAVPYVYNGSTWKIGLG